MSTTRRDALSRWRIEAHGAITGLTAIAVLIAAVLAALIALAPIVSVLPASFSDWVADYSHVPSFLSWIISDTTDAQFYKSTLGGVLLLGGGAVAHWAYRRNERWRGFDIGCGTGLWPWLVASALLGVTLSNLLWGWTITETGSWQPTFVSFVSVPPAVVLLYGAGWTVALTGAALGATLTTPLALLAFNLVCVPLGLPSVVAATTGMWVSALIGFALCRVLPWMPRDVAVKKSGPAGEGVATTDGYGPVWILRRVLADFTEAQFHGNEWASIGLIVGVLLTYLLDPTLVAYGSGLLPEMLAAQVLTAALGVVLWRRQWIKSGWYPTFIPVVSVAPATVLAYDGSTQAVIAGAVLGAIIAPPLGAALGRRLPASFHPFIGYVLSMTICGLTIVPALGLIPGFEKG